MHQNRQLHSLFLHIFHDTCHKSIGTLGIGLCTQLVEIYNHFLSVALTDHMNHIGAVWVSCTDGIQVDTCGDNLSTIVVNMIADNFGTSRSGKEFCLVMMIFLLKIYCEIGITCTALLCLTVDFFSTSAAGILIVPIFISSCFCKISVHFLDA